MAIVLEERVDRLEALLGQFIVSTNAMMIRSEFDIVAVSDKYVLVNETKSMPKIDYINEFIEMLPQFKEFFPEYQDRIVLPIFSSLYLPEEIVQ
ncbi:hypothetical protein U14_05360 [Candidatus Moduliflexus flocculans]|uniref:Uncharacterized protein n=1 Tax=Candidatus Moduliflexus flocculans TaxID=1499966 RepID=A0A081BRQ2_9BACT|nr:hypothetical protein U14_05360 [Candidatus Moduliflexus flocculans]